MRTEKRHHRNIYFAIIYTVRLLETLQYYTTAWFLYNVARTLLPLLIFEHSYSAQNIVTVRRQD